MYIVKVVQVEGYGMVTQCCTMCHPMPMVRSEHHNIIIVHQSTLDHNRLSIYLHLSGGITPIVPTLRNDDIVHVCVGKDHP